MDMTNVTASGPQYGLLDVLFGNVPEESKSGEASNPMMKLIEALGKKVEAEATTAKQGWTDEETGLGKKAEDYRFVMVPGMYAVSNQGDEVPLDQLKMVPVRETVDESAGVRGKKAGIQQMGPMPLLAHPVPVPQESPAQGALPQEMKPVAKKPAVQDASAMVEMPRTTKPAGEGAAHKNPAVKEMPAEAPELQKLQAKAEQMGLNPSKVEHVQEAVVAKHLASAKKQAKAGERITTTEDFLQMKEAPKGVRDLAPREMPKPDFAGESAEAAEWKPAPSAQQQPTEARPEVSSGKRLQVADGGTVPSKMKDGARGALVGGELVSEPMSGKPSDSAQVKDVFLQGSRPDQIRGGLLSEVASSVGLQAVKGGGEMKLVIHPEHLGELKVKVGAKNGKVEVQVEAENKDVANILKSGKSDLQDALGDQNLALTKFEVTVKETSNSNPGNDRNMANQQFDQQGNPGMFDGGMQGDSRQQRESEFRSVMDLPIPKTASPQGKASYSAVKGSNRMLDVVA